MMIVHDEFHQFFSDAQILNLHRLRSLASFANGWIIGEEFNQRFVTEVGGHSLMFTQWLDENNALKGDVQRDARGNPSMVQRPSVIIDYENNGERHTAEDAASRPEMAGALARLREREVLYAQHLEKREANRVLWAKRREALDVEMKRRGVRFLPRQVVRRVYESVVS